MIGTDLWFKIFKSFSFSTQNFLKGLQKNPNRLDYLGERSYILNLYSFEDDYFQKLLNSRFEIDKLKIKIDILDSFEKEKLKLVD